jgi:plastocyanin
MRSILVLALLAAAAVTVGCSSSNNNPPPPPPDSGTPDSGTPDSGTPDGGGPFVLTISGFSFSPADFTVDAGTTIEVHNTSGTSHTVTSEATDNAFTHAGVNGVTFDVSIGGGGTATFTIPANAPTGTVVPYYCAIHTSAMSTPNGHITIH